MDWGRALTIWAGAAAIGGGFFALERAVGDDFFARGGCVMAGYGVVLGSLSLRAREAYGRSLDVLQSEQVHLAQLLHEEHVAGGPRAPRDAARIQKLLRECEERLEKLRASSQRFTDLRRVEGPVILIGTVIWGFGDLMMRAV
ncbi:MAG: hypothetical protein AAFR16_00760 [Pseudomonadota bacterium]